jgi:hypothetical protein
MASSGGPEDVSQPDSLPNNSDWPPSGFLVSGCITGFYYGSGTLVSGHVSSGGLGHVKCHKCKGSPLYTDAHYISSDGGYYCNSCMDYEPGNGFTRQGEDLLLEFMNDPPWEAIADWFEEQGRMKSAAWIREHRC